MTVTAKSVSKRTLKGPAVAALFVVCIAIASAIAISTPAQRAEAATDSAARFMQKVAKDLQSAGRLGSRKSFQRSIKRYADVAYIGTVSLGAYLPKLKKSRKNDYYLGVRRFMARYFAAQSRNYKVTKTQIASKSTKKGRNTLVDSKIFLSNGRSYNVTWKLVRSGKTYRIQDAQVLGFWLTPFLRDAFVGYVKQNSGSVNKLIVALKR